MANELIKMKTGTIAKLEQKTNNVPDVPLDKGTVYFAVDTDTHKGKIVYDAPVGANGVDRIVMSSESEYADYAKEAGKATGITGIYPVKGTQTATTASWTGVIHGVSELIDGLTIAYYLPTTSANNVTLNLTFEDGSSTGAIPVYWTGISRATTHYAAGSTIILTYWSAGSISADGTAIPEARWTHADYDSTNIYQLRHNNGTYTTTTATGRYMLFLSHPTSGTSLIPITAVNNSTSTTKALTTAKFDPFGPILYYAYSSTTAIAANATLTVASLYQQIAFDLRYSFNTGSTLTNNKDVYIKAIPQTDGTAVLDTATPITQTLPTSADDRIYIYLGHAYSTSAVELHPVHPIYYYKNGKIALYTGEPEASTTSAGLMSAADKAKLDGIAAGAQVNSVTGVKGDSESTYRTGNVNITKANIGLGNVENKSSATIRGEITSSNVTTALGYTPATQDVATSTSDGLMSSTDKTKFDSMKVDDIVGSEPISVSISSRKATVSHDKKGPSTSSNTAKGDTTNQAPGFGESFKVTSGTVDVYGHTTAFAEHTVTIPATEASTSVKGLMTTSQVTKLNGIATGAEVNQNAFANVKVGSTTIAADAKQDTLELAGSNVTLTPDATNDKVTIGITKNNVTSALGYTPPTTNTTYEVATSSTDGLMSSTDKANFDSGVGIAGTTVSIGGSISATTLRTNLGLSNALHFIGKATVAITDGSTTDPVISGYSTKTAGDVIIDKDNSREYVWDGAKWEELGPDGSYSLVDHTHPDATTSNAGFMTATMVSKLNGIASGATKTTISATAPISASASTGAVSITHDTSGVTAQAYGETGNKTPGFGSTFSVPSFTVNATGHVTVAESHTVKIPNTAATTSAAGLMSADDKTKLDGIATGANKLELGTTSTTAAAGDHTHTTGLATDTGTSSITLASGGKYKLTAGGTSVIFTMPTSTNYTHPTTTAVTPAAVKVGNDANGHVVIGSALTASDVGAKAVQSTISSPTASGTGISYIETITQDAQGVISATKSTVRDASDAQSGVVSTSAQTFAGNKTFKGHVYPQADSTYDMGSTTLHWRHGYYDDLYVSTDTGYTANNSAKVGSFIGAGNIHLTNTTPTITFHRATAAAATGNIISDTAAGIHITGTVGTENTTYSSRSIKPLVKMDGIVYSTSNIESAGYFLNNTTGGNNTGYYTYGNNVQYGRIYIETIGKAGSVTTTYTNPEDETQTVDGYTGNTTGVMTLILGNDKAVGTNGTSYSSPGTAGTANNARGRIRLYSTNTKYIDILAQTNGNRTVYLPNYGGDMYLIHASNNNAVGGTDTPVYIAANGRATALTGTIKNNISGSAAKLTTAREIYVDLASTRNTSSKVTFDGSADKAIHVSGTLPVARGGTGLTTTTNVNAVVIGNSTTATNAMQTVRTTSGAFYATAQDGKPQFGTLPVAQGGTGATDASGARTNLGLGTLATKSTISNHTYTPAGMITLTSGTMTTTVSPAQSGETTYTPAGTITPNGTTSTTTVVKTASFNEVLVDAEVTNEVLTISFGVSGSKTDQSDVRIADPAYTFTGTGVRLVTGNIDRPTSASFAGTQATLTHTTS